MVEVKLNLFICNVYTKLLKGVPLEIFKAKNVQYTNSAIIIAVKIIIKEIFRIYHETCRNQVILICIRMINVTNNNNIIAIIFSLAERRKEKRVGSEARYLKAKNTYTVKRARSVLSNALIR